MEAHEPPTYDIYGQQIKKRQRARPVESTKLPSSWENAPTVPSKTELMRKRNEENLPDISYDLDNDGVVSGHDLVLAKIFDLDKDGRLNSQERANAEKALEEGFAKQITWGCEVSGAQRAFRILQKRGQVLMSEDFNPVANTYPRTQSHDPPIKTQTELKSQRKQNAITAAATLQSKWEVFNPNQVSVAIDYQNRYNSNPRYKSLTQKKKIERLEAREKAGLGPPNILSTSVQLSSNYIENPKNRDLSSLRENRKVELRESLNQGVNFSHQSDYTRVKEREKILATTAQREGKTWNQVKETIRKSNLQVFSTLFGKRPLGIHGKELPKFSEHKPEYWEGRSSSRDLQNSHVTLWQTRKLGGKPDPWVVNDANSHVIQQVQDPFKLRNASEPRQKHSQQAASPETPIRQHDRKNWASTLSQFIAKHPVIREKHKKQQLNASYDVYSEPESSYPGMSLYKFEASNTPKLASVMSKERKDDLLRIGMRTSGFQYT